MHRSSSHCSPERVWNQKNAGLRSGRLLTDSRVRIPAWIDEVLDNRPSCEAFQKKEPWVCRFDWIGPCEGGIHGGQARTILDWSEKAPT